MTNKTINYKFSKPGEDDFYDINEYNSTMDLIDSELMNLEEKKLEKGGDSSQTITLFNKEILRKNLESGETLSSSHGKIQKWFSEMKDIAFSGQASDIETDGVHRFVSDGEKSSWDSKVSATGDISETKIQTLDSVSSEFPVPQAGETSRLFLGKIRKFIEDFNNFKTGIITVGKLANNGNTTTGGFALDARYGKTLLDLYNKLNNDLDKKLSANAFYITNTKTVADLYSAYITGIILIYNNSTNVPSYGSGIILRCASSYFKLLIVDDDTDAMYLWTLSGSSTALITSASKTKIF